jgi:chorismate synthase
VKKGERLGTLTNHAGGVLGGISNGEPLLFRVAFKPVATIGLPQQTVDLQGNPVELAAKGRHDPCVVPRAVPIVETMAALVLLDLALRQQVRNR